MVLEATMICLDNSEWMRNGDFIPTRMEAQHDAVNLICGAKTQSNAENTVGVMTMAGRVEVLVSLTADLGKILTSLHGMKIFGECDFLAAMQVAQLALKNRQNKNQHQRLIMFVGSPVKTDKTGLERMGRRLKKNNVAVDIVNFGEDAENAQKLEAFINAVNSTDNNSHLVNIPPGPHIMSDVLVSSPIICGEGGMGTAGAGGADGFGVDPNLDPELAEALRLSLEEERARREAEAKKQDDKGNTTEQPAVVDMAEAEDEIAQAIALSMNRPSNAAPPPQSSVPSFDEMNEEEQMALALSLSLQSQAEEAKASSSTPSSAPSSSTQPPSTTPATDTDMAAMLSDPDYVNSLLSSLPGVDPNNEQIKNFMASLKTKDDEKKDEEKK
eukprot:TRINITY_DN5921_c0_g1_i1.p1 TRINITY_DN5921_c0_g1~~TRINITY_DN5921_c0_g1_i1.p1  ORF type:complete len:429 (-),score=116.87 TRINITY_DN5921_c0_g1_i1:79-1233(-)